MYPPVTKPKNLVRNLVRSRKNSGLQTSKKLKSPTHPQNTLFARQMKHYVPTKPKKLQKI